MNPKKLQPLLAPTSIAIIGASESPDSWAPEVYSSLLHLGFEGTIIPVHPKYEQVWGLPCYPNITQVPEPVDLAVYVIRADRVVADIDNAAKAGVRSIMVVASGFAETGEEGRALQNELRDKALAHGIPLLGPNIEGFVNYVDKVAPYGTLPPRFPVAGDISVISQSGTVAWAMNQQASDRGVGLRVILGVGNEAVIGLGDMYAWAAQDPKTKVVCSYIETLRDVEGIGKGLAALQAAGKPTIICAPAGRSEAALRSIVAHTGALAGNTGIRDAWLRGLGVVLVEDPVIMFEAAVLISHHKKTPTTGVTAGLQSGGACTLFAEATGAVGLDLPAFTKKTEAKLRKALPSFANLNNPLDVTGQAAVETDMYCGALDALAHDPSIGFVAIDAFPPRGDSEDDAVWAMPVMAKARELQKETGVVFASVSMTPLAYTEASKRFVKSTKLPFLQGHRAAAGAIRALMDLQGSKAAVTKPAKSHANRAKAQRVLKGLVGPLDEEQAARILSLYGVRRPAEAMVETPEQAVAAAAKIGTRVAVKAAAPELPHKAKLGGVRLNLKGAKAVEAAASEVLAAAHLAGAKAPKVLVQEMATGAEVLVGALVDPQFGPAITIRPGGALAEAGEATFVAAPLTAKQALAYVESQADRCKLDPAKHDLGAVAKAVQAISHAVSDLRDRVSSLEANPLLVGRKGAIAVDALAEAREAKA